VRNFFNFGANADNSFAAFKYVSTRAPERGRRILFAIAFNETPAYPDPDQEAPPRLAGGRHALEP